MAADKKSDVLPGVRKVHVLAGVGVDPKVRDGVQEKFDIFNQLGVPAHGALAESQHLAGDGTRIQMFGEDKALVSVVDLPTKSL